MSESVETRTFDASSSGDNTLITVGSSQRLALKRAAVNVASDITGNVLLKVGSTTVGKIQNPIVGGNHNLLVNSPAEVFPLGDNLVANLPGTTATTWTITYLLIDS